MKRPRLRHKTEGEVQVPAYEMLRGDRGLSERMLGALLRGVSTRLYFADDPQLGSDPILALVPAERRSTLLAHSRGGSDYLWDIHMQGDAETVFFNY